MTFKTTKLRDAINFALAVSATAVAGTGVAYAQDAEQAEDLDRVVVTGTRIPRSADVESSQPVFSLTRQEIEAQGLTSIGDVIQNISTNGSTLNTTFNNGGNGETRVNLRNLGSDRTLVLVNGRRWVGGTGLGGAVDLNTIPTAAIERIEVLKDGASVIYGSDAIAGVVNVILRQNFDGAEANAYIGAFEQGDGTRQAYDFTVGSSGERWSAMLGIGYVEEDPVFAGDRTISAVPVFGSTPGLGGSSTTPNGRFCILGTTQFCEQPNGDYGLWTVTGPGTFRGWRGTPDQYNFAPDNYLITPQERTSLFASGSLDVTDNVRFSTTVTFNQRRSEQLLAAMPVVLGFPGASQASDIVISANSIYNPYGQDIGWIQRRVVETGGRSFRQDVDTFAINLGLDGTIEIADKPFYWEAGYFFGENEQNDTTDGLLTYTALRNALGASMIAADGTPICVGTPGDETTRIGGCVPLNFLGGAGTITREMLDYVTFQAHDNLGYEQETYYANIGGDLFELPAGPLSFSFGLERRTESGYDQPDALINAGDTTGNARTATAGGYSLDEAYLELAIPVLADVPGARLLDFSVATRYSDYSNFGDTTNSKFGFRWKPIDDLMVRGNWTEGFRAPSVSDLFLGQSDSFPELTDPCNSSEIGTLDSRGVALCNGTTSYGGVPVGGYTQNNSQIRITVGGNTDLKPESSITTTFGFVYSPSWLEGFNVSLDWWKIELEDVIRTPSGEAIADSCYRDLNLAQCQLITRGAGGFITDLSAVSRNLGKRDVEGYDMTVSYAIPETSYGKFSVIWDTTYLASFVDDDPLDAFDQDDNLAGDYDDRNNNWRIRSNVTLNWQKGDWSANWMMRYYSGQDESCRGFSSNRTLELRNRALLCSDPNRRTDRGEAPQNYLGGTVYNDANVTWAAPWNARVTVGVNNILDRDPPRSASTFANSFDPQYEIPGRFLFMRYSQKF